MLENVDILKTKDPTTDPNELLDVVKNNYRESYGKFGPSNDYKDYILNIMNNLTLEKCREVVNIDMSFLIDASIELANEKSLNDDVKEKLKGNSDEAARLLLHTIKTFDEGDIEILNKHGILDLSYNDEMGCYVMLANNETYLANDEYSPFYKVL